jgi:REP element-mobilizing transposase RayT
MSDPNPPPVDLAPFPRRKSIRLKRHDYSDGIYFITICVWKRLPLLSRIAGGRIYLTSVGRIVKDEWLGTNQIRRNAWVDAFVIMPNHFHGIVVLNGEGMDSEFRAHAVRPYMDGASAHPMHSPGLGRLIAGFKSACTRRYHELAGDAAGALWQRGYYERVIRTQRALQAIRRYIATNPRGQDAQHRVAFFNTRQHAPE